MAKDSNINELYVSDKEFEALMKCSSKIRYSYTLKRIADTETMWSLCNKESHFAIQNCDDRRLFPIWSSKEYAQPFCTKEWKDFDCTAITLDYFEEHLIDYICQKGLLINVFPTTSNPIDNIVRLNTFAEDLSKALEDY